MADQIHVRRTLMLLGIAIAAGLITLGVTGSNTRTHSQTEAAVNSVVARCNADLIGLTSDSDHNPIPISARIAADYSIDQLRIALDTLPPHAFTTVPSCRNIIRGAIAMQLDRARDSAD